MIILHGSFVDDRLFVWGEAPNDAPKRAARKRKNGGAPLPYDAGFDKVAKAVKTLPSGLKPTRKRQEQATAWLPSLCGHALPSSALIGEAPSKEGEVEVAPWLVDGLMLDAKESLALLAASSASSTHGLIPGRDFSYWGRALKVAGSLVTRQRYLPGIEERDGEYFARWQPIWLGEDVAALEALAQDMPAAARAITRNGAVDPPETPPAELLAGFVATLVDHIVWTCR